MTYDRQEECMRVTLQMNFTHAHLEPLKAAHSTYISMYCYGRALGNNPGPVAGSGSLSVEWHPLTGTEALKSCLATVGHSTWYTRHRMSKWLPVVVLPVKSRGCGGDDGEWW